MPDAEADAAAMTGGPQRLANRVSGTSERATADPFAAERPMVPKRPFPVERVVAESSPWLAPGAALIDACLGSGYVSVSALQAIVRHPTQAAAVFITRDESCVLGISTARVARRDDRSRIDRGLSALGLPVDAVAPVGLLSSVAVAPTARGNGIGDNLTTAGIDFLWGEGCAVLYAEAWASSPGPQSSGILRRHGFEALGLVPAHWARAGAPPVPCVLCGQSCECTALLMRLAGRGGRAV